MREPDCNHQSAVEFEMSVAMFNLGYFPQ